MEQGISSIPSQAAPIMFYPDAPVRILKGPSRQIAIVLCLTLQKWAKTDHYLAQHHTVPSTARWKTVVDGKSHMNNWQGLCHWQLFLVITRPWDPCNNGEMRGKRTPWQNSWKAKTRNEEGEQERDILWKWNNSQPYCLCERWMNRAPFIKVTARTEIHTTTTDMSYVYQ